ncbi:MULTISPECIES: KinB signaling pathway activation protein KbaA [Bacillus cereus group]|uniref:KinB-signaling pathway activation protein n=1 Tax=Bacillus toyonensis TaxID=155322 RepID=A0AB73SCU4_9BACI|nr:MULTISPECIES: KinB signaling pathway activation protein KbaA [Bacillus cereus group]MBJ7932700.1 KinB signaling pathway activation protein KbaA [Bacillus cereus group sp. N31]PEG13625.1 KINB signaling pathway activation protein [Bacillus toyonensis]PEI87440.1 KINB signaling pathway activation protein [Bacillus toyonensis]PEK10571.1 KINB signaling pathway activation protein [Bacillus toyonensis]PEK50625.1 KINB signaling pathway activation protein [Bacillus toyonensis]
MNSRKWVRLFLTTLFLGGVSTVIIGFVLEWDKYDKFFQNFDVREILAVSFWLMGVGFIFSVISQMGFFAYLTIHRFGLGMFRSSSLWNVVQLFFIAFVLFDFVYLRSVLIANGEVSLGNNILVAGILFVFGAIVAYIKSKETNKKAFVPALFFMVVVTILEWVPALRINDTDWLYLMVIPLLLCNAYQLLILHRLIGKTSKAA